jgi:hypothetical protein
LAFDSVGLDALDDVIAHVHRELEHPDDLGVVGDDVVSERLQRVQRGRLGSGLGLEQGLDFGPQLLPGRLLFGQLFGSCSSPAPQSHRARYPQSAQI